MPLRAPISPSGSLPGDTDEILWLPIDCAECPWNCGVRRKGAVQKRANDRLNPKRPAKSHDPSCSYTLARDSMRPPHTLPTAQDGVCSYCKFISSSSTSICRITPQLVPSKHCLTIWKYSGAEVFSAAVEWLSFSPFLYDDVVYIICSMGSLPFHWRVYFKYQHRLVF